MQPVKAIIKKNKGGGIGGTPNVFSSNQYSVRIFFFSFLFPSIPFT
jgi:hypothetical protein